MYFRGLREREETNRNAGFGEAFDSLVGVLEDVIEDFGLGTSRPDVWIYHTVYDDSTNTIREDSGAEKGESDELSPSIDLDASRKYDVQVRSKSSW